VAHPAANAAETQEAGTSAQVPVLPPGIQQLFIPPAVAGQTPLYAPVILGAARVPFSDTRLGIDVSRDVVYAAPIGEGAVAVDWARAAALDIAVTDLQRAAEAGASFQPVPPAAAQPRNYPAWEKAFGRWVAQAEKIELMRDRESNLTSRPEESARDFRVRLQDVSRSARDSALEAMHSKYAAKQAAMAERLRRAEAAAGRESEQASQQKIQTAVSFGATLFGALLGRKMVSATTLGRATTAARGVGRTMKESSDVRRATEAVDAVRAQAQQLDEQIQEEAKMITAKFEAPADFERVTLAPKRGQVSVQLIALGWDPS
jgi:hypothetical protein